jgi:hypothetical protein
VRVNPLLSFVRESTRALPLVNPAEGDVLRTARGTDIRVDDGGFEPVEGAAELKVILPSRRPPDDLQEVVRLELELAGDFVEAAVFHVREDRGRPDEHIRIPDGRHAVILVRQHGDEDAVLIVLVFDWLHPLGFRKREEWPLHRVFLVAELQVDDVGKE